MSRKTQRVTCTSQKETSHVGCDIVLFGNLTAPAALVPIVQALTIEQYGNITAAGSA